jgi:hypothetical protein
MTVASFWSDPALMCASALTIYPMSDRTNLHTALADAQPAKTTASAILRGRRRAMQILLRRVLLLLRKRRSTLPARDKRCVHRRPVIPRNAKHRYNPCTAVDVVKQRHPPVVGQLRLGKAKHRRVMTSGVQPTQRSRCPNRKDQFMLRLNARSGYSQLVMRHLVAPSDDLIWKLLALMPSGDCPTQRSRNLLTQRDGVDLRAGSHPSRTQPGLFPHRAEHTSWNSHWRPRALRKSTAHRRIQLQPGVVLP